GVDDQRAVAHFREVQLPGLAVGDFDHGEAEAAEDLEVDARVAAHLGHPANQEHRHRHAALQQRPGDDEAVAAVVAAAAQHRHLPLRQVAVDRLDRRHRLAPGVLHQHERGDADVLDRAAIGFFHLGGVQNSHNAATEDTEDTEDREGTEDADADGETAGNGDKSGKGDTSGKTYTTP